MPKEAQYRINDGAIQKYDHELKIWPEPYRDLITQRKRYEIRKADRPFKVDDSIVFREWSPKAQTYTGRACDGWITFITQPGEWGLPNDLCVFEVNLVRRWDKS